MSDFIVNFLAVLIRAARLALFSALMIVRGIFQWAMQLIVTLCLIVFILCLFTMRGDDIFWEVIWFTSGTAIGLNLLSFAFDWLILKLDPHGGLYLGD